VTLTDLRKHTIKKKQRVRFRLKNGLDCIVNEDGVALIPGLDRVPDFNLDRELTDVISFTIELLPVAGQKNAPAPKTLTRAELDSMLSATPSAAAAHDDHDDE
jgi:hypothetical protein